MKHSTMKYAARINSFINQGLSVVDALAAVSSVNEVSYVDLNYPEHFADDNVEAIQRLVDEHGLAVNSIAVRFRRDFRHGEFTGPDGVVSEAAYELVRRGIDAAQALDCDLITLWLGYDGYDYAFQKDYVEATDRLVTVFRRLADEYPSMRFSIEYKPYEERVHAMIPSSGFVLYLLERIDRTGVGATLDFCHMIMARDYPAHAAALLLASKKLFGVHLNDGYQGTDDGLIVGSVHLWETLEFLDCLRQGGYDAPIYFDTFPVREEACGELQANAQAVDDLLSLLDRTDRALITKAIATQGGLDAAALRSVILNPDREADDHA